MARAPEHAFQDGPDHHDGDDHDGGEFTMVHLTWSSVSIRSRSRSASICAAVSAPRSVTMRSSTLIRSCSCCTWPAQPVVFDVVSPMHLANRAVGNPHLVPDDGEGEHHEDEAQGRTRRGSLGLVLQRNAILSAQRLDLRGGLGAAVGDDLLEHPQPGFDLVHVLGILSALLGREIALRGDLLSP